MQNYIKQIKNFSSSAKWFLVIGILSGTSMGMRRVVRNLYFLSLGYREEFIGIVIAVATIFGVFIALPSGKISDYFGRMKALIMAIAISVVGVALQGTISKFSIIMGASLHRMGIGLIYIAGPAFLAEQSKMEERTHLFSVYEGIRRMSIMLGALAGGYLPGIIGGMMAVHGENPLSYRFTIFIQAFILLLAFIPIAFLNEDDCREEECDEEEDNSLFNLKFVQTGLPKKVIIPAVLVGTGAGFIFPFMNVIFKHFGASTRTIGWIFSWESIISGLATLSVPYIALKWGKVKGLTIIRLLSIPFLLIIGFSGYIPVMAVSLWIRSSLMRMGMPLRKNVYMDVTVYRDRSKVNSLHQVAFRTGWAMAGPVAGWILANFSYSLPFVITSVFYVGGVISFYRYFHPMEKRTEEQEL